MLQKGLYKYYKEQYKVIDKNYHIAKENFDIEAIHDLRVGIKKIRALFKLVGNITPLGFKAKKHFVPIKNLFKAAGLLRDIQIQQVLLKKYSENQTITYKALESYLEKLNDDSGKTLMKALEKFNLGVLDNKLQKIRVALQEIDEDILIVSSINLVNECFVKIDKLKTNEDEESIHDIRTHLKDALYILKLLEKHSPNFHYEINSRKLKNTGDLLGEWHDKVVDRKSVV